MWARDRTYWPMVLAQMVVRDPHHDFANGCWFCATGGIQRIACVADSARVSTGASPFMAARPGYSEMFAACAGLVCGAAVVCISSTCESGLSKLFTASAEIGGDGEVVI